jgi:hypothetical protein
MPHHVVLAVTDSHRTEFLSKKSVTHDQADSGIPPAFQAQPDEWRWAAARLTPWRNIERNDYDFRGWTEGASEELLLAGCLYEYARESHELRCLYALVRRERGPLGPIIAKYERNSAGHIALVRSGWEHFLYDFADELVANLSFAEVLRADGAKVHKSLKILRGYSPYPKAVELPGQYINVLGSQEVVINWRHYTNKEISAEIARMRPKSEPEPNRRGREPQSKALSKALSVMRIWTLYKRNPWKRLELVAKVCRYRGCVIEWAAYKERCRQGRGDEPMSNAAKAELSRSRKRALSFFQFVFPWGKPANW